MNRRDFIQQTALTTGGMLI
ncbi:twin-arginine translocation signal domain-containing protein, partial [Acinetobacter baumannii]